MRGVGRETPANIVEIKAHAQKRWTTTSTTLFHWPASPVLCVGFFVLRDLSGTAERGASDGRIDAMGKSLTTTTNPVKFA